MPMNEKALRARDSKRDIGAELLESVRRVKAGDVGRVHVVPVSLALEARQRLALSQSQFADVLGVSVRTLQDWEQKRRRPSKTACTLIKIAASRPDVVHEALRMEETEAPAVSRNLNVLKIGGCDAVVAYDPEIEKFRGEFTGLTGHVDFYASSVEELKVEGKRSLATFRAVSKERNIKPRQTRDTR